MMIDECVMCIFINTSTFNQLHFQADLKGIKWHKFSSDAAGFGGDPVLSAFTKCLALDILAVWRRAPRKSSDSNQLGRVIV